jgi:cyclopropane fatty-acyl-phospholipid synthase-like methyltransferase
MTTKIYQSQYKFFERAYALNKDLWTDFKDDPIVKQVGKLIKKDNPHGKILDLGCGRGRNSILLAKLGFEVWGVDLIPKALNEAKKAAQVEKLNGKVHFEKADVLNLPFEKDSFDGIIDRGCFHHIVKQDWAKYRRNINKVLKDDGYFLVVVFSKESPHLKSTKHNYVVHKGDIGVHFHYDHFFTKKELKEAFPNFKLVDLHEKNDDPYIFYYAIMKKMN